MSACRYGDPRCPCQDGDPCHYEGDDPMMVHPAYVRRVTPARLGDSTEAYAAVENGEVVVNSISDTRRAAMVNFLIVRRHIMVSNFTTTEEIVDLFTKHRRNAVIRSINVTVAEGD